VADSCRCGRQTPSSHPCHYGGYTCTRDGRLRLYGTGRPFSLAGAQVKASVRETFACDEHWAAYVAEYGDRLNPFPGMVP